MIFIDQTNKYFPCCGVVWRVFVIKLYFRKESNLEKKNVKSFESDQSQDTLARED